MAHHQQPRMRHAGHRNVAQPQRDPGPETPGSLACRTTARGARRVCPQRLVDIVTSAGEPNIRHITEIMKANWQKFISQHDVVYPTPPSCWQDGFLMGNGAMGALFFAPAALEWIINKTDVLDARTRPVRRIIPPDEAKRMVRNGA